MSKNRLKTALIVGASLLTDVLAVFEKSALVGRQWTENE